MPRESPSYRVTQRDVSLIIGMRTWLAHPERREVLEQRDEYEKYHEAQTRVFVEYEKAFVRELCATLPAKLPEARASMQHAIVGLTENKLVGIPPCQ